MSMTDDPRLAMLLDELTASRRSPEEVCSKCPELLPLVRRRWRQMRRVSAQLDALFPPSGDGAGRLPHRLADESAIPKIDGYEFEAVLGRGGMGVVYRARHLQLGRTVALKMLLAGSYAGREESERFLHEAQMVAGLHHPNIVQLYEVGQVDSRPYFTMELVEGGNLAQKLSGTPLAARDAAHLIAELAEAVEAAHQRGVIHRDLKPANVLLSGEWPVASDKHESDSAVPVTRPLSLVTPKITDFGLARQLESGLGLTLTGAPLGTPSYMAPEQARGDKKAVGPATDIYSLGAILYECLTGRPPFRADRPAATLQQVLTDEPASPARLNRRVSRDLETICLKCLRKEPQKRYASAQALADDLRRFERGEPIKARRVGSLERAARWARRRPALAGATFSGILLAFALVGTIVWWHGQQTALRATAIAYAEADLTESERLRDQGDFATSAAVLQRAKDRLGEFVPPELHNRLQAGLNNLQLVIRLDAVRLERALLGSPADLIGVLALPGQAATEDGYGLPSPLHSGRHYDEAFRAAGIGSAGDDRAAAAAHVRASPVRGALVAALDDWAACVTDEDQQAWVLAVLREADPDAWRDRIRDPGTWENTDALRELAAGAPVTEQSPQLLAVLGARLRAKKIDAVPFLARVVAAYPNDFWANIEMGNACYEQKSAAEAVGYYRAALALRPQAVSIHYALGSLYLGLGSQRWDQSIAEYREAVRLDPANARYHNRLGIALAWKGCNDEALVEFREAIRIDPNVGWSHHCLAVTLERQHHFDEAVGEFQTAAALSSEKRAQWNGDARKLLLRLGRVAEAQAIWKEDLATHPPKHDDWFGYAELCLFLGDEAEYRRARRELLAQFGSTTDPAIAERTGRASLLLHTEDGELNQAVALTVRAVAVGRAGREFAFPYFLFAEGLARYREGRLDEANKLLSGEAGSVMRPCPRLILAMVQHQNGQHEEARKTLAAAIASYDWTPTKADNHDAWIAHILRREAEALIGSSSIREQLSLP
jgi:serine/threonine-protein kinase